MDNWVKPGTKTILPKNFGKKPKPVKKLESKICQRCNETYVSRFNSANEKFCNDCKPLIWTERSNQYRKIKRGCIQCKIKDGAKVITENDQGEEEVWCKPCYSKALQDA